MNSNKYRLIPQRIERLRGLIRSCQLCPRNCGKDRSAGQAGYCGVDNQLYCFREMLYEGEEKELCPSHQIYFSGCNMRCEYCSVAEWNENPKQARRISLLGLAEAVKLQSQQGAITLNLLGGEPAVNVLGILEFLYQIKPTIPVVWNSNMYYNTCVSDAICGVADVVLADLKFGNDTCAESIAKVSGYCGVVISNIKDAADWSRVIVRHRVLPGHFECCTKPGLKKIAAIGQKVDVSLWFDYIPPIPAAMTPSDYVGRQQQEKTIEYAKNLGLRIIL